MNLWIIKLIANTHRVSQTWSNLQRHRSLNSTMKNILMIESRRSEVRESKSKEVSMEGVAEIKLLKLLTLCQNWVSSKVKNFRTLNSQKWNWEMKVRVKPQRRIILRLFPILFLHQSAQGKYSICFFTMRLICLELKDLCLFNSQPHAAVNALEI